MFSHVFVFSSDLQCWEKIFGLLKIFLFLIHDFITVIKENNIFKTTWNYMKK